MGELSITAHEPTALLQMNHVKKAFGDDVVALRDMNLRVNQGEFVSLLGPSGCGKSTALRLIAGLARPTSGTISWHGGQGSGDLGVVFQEPTLMPWAQVRHNVWLPLRLRGKSFKQSRREVSRALQLTGLEQFQYAYPRELSGGMKMRVSIARAMVTKPRLILMDEPFAALDEITRHKMNSDLLSLRDATGCTVIFVTHSVFESVFLSDRIVVMASRPGRVIRELAIDSTQPRVSEFRTSNEFASIAREASESLQQAMVA
ncbi:MAG: ABC transporter ATP-binding protein [Granulosicoccus sp.]